MLQEIAWGLVDGATGTLINGRNITVTRISTGVYDLELQPGFELDSTEMMITVTSCDPAARFTGFTSGTDTVKRVEAFNQAGMNADATICFKIERLNIL